MDIKHYTLWAEVEETAEETIDGGTNFIWKRYSKFHIVVSVFNFFSAIPLPLSFVSLALQVLVTHPGFHLMPLICYFQPLSAKHRILLFLNQCFLFVSFCISSTTITIKMPSLNILKSVSEVGSRNVHCYQHT